MKRQGTKKDSSASAEAIAAVELGKTTPLRVVIWRLRRRLRDALGGKDLLIVEPGVRNARYKAREAYRSVGAFMTRNFPKLVVDTPIEVARKMVHDRIVELGYHIIEEDLSKPWGAYYRMAGDDAHRFVQEFFPGLSLTEAKLGRKDVELSPKFLLVAPGHRLSWQYHNRRAERWRFLTAGAYYRSHDDAAPDILLHGKAGQVVQFDAGERHRLCSEPHSKNYTLVAEIWQHTDDTHHSDENDIIRLQDDYKR
jgi:mannose-6-phosphate isomerase